MGFSFLAKKVKVKIGFLISYDYKYIYDALRIVYDYADEIILAIDKDRLTWAGKPYDFDESLFEKIKAVDPKNKISFYEDAFYVPGMTPMELDTRERNMLSEKMGADCWQLQIDADEYFLNFDEVYQFLQKNRFLVYRPDLNPVNIRGNWITLFKKTENGFLYIDNEEHFPFATNLVGKYNFARDMGGKHNDEVLTNFRALHHSWARDPEEIHQKINNWSHKDDFDGEAFFKFWLSIDENNYRDIYDFHPIYKGAWLKLKFIASTDIHDFIQKFNAETVQPKPAKLQRKYFKAYKKATGKFWHR
ncbi:hypothetical protein [Flavobacterium sp.]|uniref:hypothetical protein n=1 Tax=Flavobacterium sp. TaxID=239 RepID=UPI0039E5F0BD